MNEIEDELNLYIIKATLIEKHIIYIDVESKSKNEAYNIALNTAWEMASEDLSEYKRSRNIDLEFLESDQSDLDKFIKSPLSERKN
jgi:hypothetical protein